MTTENKAKTGIIFLDYKHFKECVPFLLCLTVILGLCVYLSDINACPLSLGMCVYLSDIKACPLSLGLCAYLSDIKACPLSLGLCVYLSDI